MKNLFSINKTENRDANDFDETPYLAATVSEAVQSKLKGSFAIVEDKMTPHEPTEEEKALKKKSTLYWLLCAGCLIAAFALFFGGDRTGLYASLPVLHVVDAGLLVASLVFNFKARRITRKQAEVGNEHIRFDFSEATKQLQEAAAEAARELGVPDQALSVDILPFHYIIKGNEMRPAGKKGHFDNLSVSVYVSDGALCMATAQELFRIPLEEIRGYREYDEDFELDMWLKPEESDSDKYREYGLRRSGMMGRRGHGYFGIDVGGEFEILVPCYDFPPVRELLHLTQKL